mgnify:FL=1
MKLLIVNPAFSRLNSPGAAELDLFAIARRLAALSHTVRILQPVIGAQKPDDVIRFFNMADVPDIVIDPVPFSVSMRDPRRLFDPAYWDGAGWMYASPAFTRIVQAAIRAYQPDGVIALMSFGWGAARAARKLGLPASVRSQNNEASHMLQENGVTVPNLIRYIGKMRGEKNVARFSTVVAAITPVEAAFYSAIAPGTAVVTLPLGTLPELLAPPRPPRDARPLHVFFMGSSYNVPHNRKALMFVVDDVLPMLRARLPGEFIVHILGSKTPAAAQAKAAPDLIFEGYVSDLDAFLAGMDAAIVPSLGGAGMQQKVFEPLCRAFPVITHRRVLAGYPYRDGEDLLTGETAADFVEHLGALRDPVLREKLSRNAAARSAALFGADRLDEALQLITTHLGTTLV